MKSRPLLVAAALSFVAGYVDTLCFVALFGLFSAHVTGNFVLIGSELVHPSQGVLLKWLAFPAFIAGVATARLLNLRWQGARPCLVLQGILLGGCMLAGAAAEPDLHPHGLWTVTAGILAAAAMGVQNAAARLTWAALSPTTVMTGNVTQVVIDMVDWRRAESSEARARVPRLAWPIAAFAAGAVSGAVGYELIAFWALVQPLVIIAVLAIQR